MSLDLSSNNMTTRGAVGVAVALAPQSHLQRLQLQDNSIRDDAVALGHALVRLLALRHIDLSDNPMSLADCCALFAVMTCGTAPTATLALPANLFLEFPALFSRSRVSEPVTYTEICWCAPHLRARADRKLTQMLSPGGCPIASK